MPRRPGQPGKMMKCHEAQPAAQRPSHAPALDHVPPTAPALDREAPPTAPDMDREAPPTAPDREVLPTAPDHEAPSTAPAQDLEAPPSAPVMDPAPHPGEVPQLQAVALAAEPTGFYVIMWYLDIYIHQ